jgi:hypothetical protein
MFEIEKDVPVSRRNNICSALRETIKSMKIGDSFLVPYSEWAGKKSPVCTSAYIMAKRLGMRVITRSLPGEKGTRIWRIE